MKISVCLKMITWLMVYLGFVWGAAAAEFTAAANISFAEDPTRFTAFSSNSIPMAKACLGPYGGFFGALGNACTSVEGRGLHLTASAHTEQRKRLDLGEGVNAGGIATASDTLHVAAPAFAFLPAQRAMVTVRVHGSLTASGRNSRASVRAEARAVHLDQSVKSPAPAVMDANLRGDTGASSTRKVDTELVIPWSFPARPLVFWDVELRLHLNGGAATQEEFEGPGDASMYFGKTMEVTSVSFFDAAGNPVPGIAVTSESGTGYPVNVATNWPTAPLLSARMEGTNSVIISWPSSMGGFVLQEGAGFETPSWRNVTKSPVPLEEEYRVTLPLAAGSRFYRLALP